MPQNNNLTPEDDLLTREFYKTIVQNSELAVWDKFSQRDAIMLCIGLLGYTIHKGNYVYEEDLQGVTYGNTQAIPCRWDEDTREVAARVVANETAGPDETYNSKPTTDTEIREALFREDV